MITNIINPLYRLLISFLFGTSDYVHKVAMRGHSYLFLSYVAAADGPFSLKNRYRSSFLPCC